jgi:RNA polymerase sigma-70 factor (ECF subfamily)
MDMAGGGVPTPKVPLRLLRASEQEGGPPPGDAELIAALREGRPGSGARLYDVLLPVVDGTLYRLLGAREQEHDDLVQAAFEQIVSTLLKRRFRGRCSLVGWASIVTCHVGLSALRSRARERRVFDRRADPEPPTRDAAGAGDPERQVEAHRELEAVRRHLSEMDAERAAALFLHAAGHSLEEIAQVADVSVAAAQSRLSRGRRDLLARMAAERTAHAPTTIPMRSQ